MAANATARADYCLGIVTQGRRQMAPLLLPLTTWPTSARARRHQNIEGEEKKDRKAQEEEEALRIMDFNGGRESAMAKA